MSLSIENIFDKVKATLVDALGVDDDEVTLESRIGEDLGAESIDYLDISFRLEKDFSIKISESEMFDQSLLGDQNFIQEGSVTAEGIKMLEAKMPHANFEEFRKDPKVENLSNIFTVGINIEFPSFMST